MSDGLREDLLEIRGIGESKADEIIAVYEEHGVAPIDQIIQDAREQLDQALDYHAVGRPDYAEKFVHRAYDMLTLEE